MLQRKAKTLQHEADVVTILVAFVDHGQKEYLTILLLTIPQTNDELVHAYDLSSNKVNIKNDPPLCSSPDSDKECCRCLKPKSCLDNGCEERRGRCVDMLKADLKGKKFKETWESDPKLKKAFEESKLLLTKAVNLNFPDPAAPLAGVAAAPGAALGTR